MSYFTDMFKAVPEGFKAFTILIGQYGNAVAYRLNDKGEPIGFATGPVSDVIGESLNAMDSAYRVIRGFRGQERPHHPNQWTNLPWVETNTWEEFARIMNKKGILAAKMNANYDMMESHFDIGTIIYDRNTRKYIVTDKGKAADAKLTKPKETP